MNWRFIYLNHPAVCDHCGKTLRKRTGAWWIPGYVRCNRCIEKTGGVYRPSREETAELDDFGKTD